ncbi:hypothetical protein [Jiangella asiatica]|uniref:Methyltransferase domain-containing protein n=1 Tax=Jiangella asiatica TaxID=2530372 RepID=A0A4R5CLF8_9ACTN|nr:hypothetical protein [Jiangella asiatica]TDD98294.1 hypothetical protein E1269_28815 [Jiangella asiatica]
MSDPTPPHIARLVPRLGLTGTERVLELGGAPGVAAAEVGRLLSGTGHLTVVDRSITGLRRTTERNRELVDAGRLTVVQRDLTTIEPGTTTSPPAASTSSSPATSMCSGRTRPGRTWRRSRHCSACPAAGCGYGDDDGARGDVGERVAATLDAQDALTAVEVHAVSASVEIRARRAAS